MTSYLATWTVPRRATAARATAARATLGTPPRAKASRTAAEANTAVQSSGLEVGDGADGVRPMTRTLADGGGERTTQGRGHAGADAGEDAAEDTLLRTQWATQSAPDEVRRGLER